MTTSSATNVYGARRSRLRGWAWLLHVAWVCSVGDAEEVVDFNFQVRPLLSDRCFRCHGPDERARKAKLRLDTADGLGAAGGTAGATPVIVPGHPEQSLLYRRITTSDPDDVMPPPSSQLALTGEEKESLRRWIAQGGEVQPHWAFRTVQSPAVPALVDASTARNPIDAFVGARLQREGLKFSAEASREALIRRVSLDLTGLPPTLAEVDAFLADSAADAYERLVDRLLASPAYGERRANEWLDLARYADTYGYQADVERDMSPWRDWVIGAFNRNLPYDQFVVWQLAGDLLPDATPEQVLATAFNRLHRQTNEGGSIDEEFRTEYAADRVHTMGTAFLGLTLECARCHDHKFDPITQRDYYRLFAFFNNIDESGLYSHFTQATPSPTLLLYPAGVEARHRELRRRISDTERGVQTWREKQQPAFADWFASSNRTFALPSPVAHYAFDESATNTSPDSVQTNRVATLVDGPVLTDGKLGRALRFSGDNSAVCAGAGAFDRTQPFSLSLWLQPGERTSRQVVLHRSRAWSDSGSRGYELVLEDGEPTFGLIHFWPGNAIQVRAPRALPIHEWTHVVVTYDGSSRAAGVRLYLNGQRQELRVIRDHLFKGILHRKEWSDADVGGIELTLAGRFRDSGFKGGAIDDLRVYDVCLTALEVRALDGAAETPASSDDWREYYLARVDADFRSSQAALQESRAEENRLVNDVPEIMVMHEMSTRRTTHLLKRGAYDAPGEIVDPGTPEQIFRFRADLPPNRLGLAGWLTDPGNPLTARVAVNRVWRTFFGRGLVATAEDFGGQGRLPTHPELLDWLAYRFVQSGWDLKDLHRLIARSSAYRQTSQASAALVARDPDNLLFARGPRHRLSAEQIRDEALCASGLLSRVVGGRSVKPYQPAGLWEESGTGKQYVQDHGEALYRRSLYTFWRRTAPPPTMLTFDATSREVCTAKRESTVTPLQALVLLNDPQFVEAARAMAETLLRKYPHDLALRIGAGFRQVLGRRPTADEQQILDRLYAEQLVYFQQDGSHAERLLRIGERPLEGTPARPELAATTLLVSALMNHDEFVMKQ